MAFFTLHCITTEGSGREESFRADLNKSGIPYEMHTFQRHQFPVLGCFESHKKMYEYAREQGMEYIAIAEDNAELQFVPEESYFRELADFMKEEEWGVIWLGTAYDPLVGPDRTRWSNFFKAGPLMSSTQCYIIHRRLYEKVLDDLEAGDGLKVGRFFRAMDVLLMDYPGRYIYRPLLFHRGTAKSIVNPFADGMRKIYLHPKVVEVHGRLFYSGALGFFWFIVFLLLVVIALTAYWLWLRFGGK